MHRHAGGLVDDDQVGVLEEDSQGDVLGLGNGRDDGRHGHGIEAGQGLGRGTRHRLAVTADNALGQKRLEPRTRQGREDIRERLVEPAAAGLKTGLQHRGGLFFALEVFDQGVVRHGALHRSSRGGGAI